MKTSKIRKKVRTTKAEKLYDRKSAASGSGENSSEMKPPKLRRCESNGVVAIVTEYDYQMWWVYVHQRDKLLEPSREGERRASPQYCMFFTDNPLRRELLGSLVTGSLEDCRELIRNCEVRDAYLFIPLSRESHTWFRPVSLAKASAFIRQFTVGSEPVDREILGSCPSVSPV